MKYAEEPQYTERNLERNKDIQPELINHFSVKPTVRYVSY
jgi:hypothetical protein